MADVKVRKPKIIARQGTAYIVIEGDTSGYRKAMNRTRDSLGKMAAAQRRLTRAQIELANAQNKTENKRRAHWRKHAGRPKSRRR